MVFKKRLDYGFNAFNVPKIPRAPRSTRRRGQSKRTVDDSQICAFELLASLAGKLLQESESSASSNASEGHDHVSIGKDVVKQEIQYDDKPLKTECFEQGSCEASVVASVSTTENSDNLKEFTHAENDAILERTLIKTQPAFLEQIGGDSKSVICKGNVAYGNFPCNANVDGYSPDIGELCDGKSENGFKQEQDARGLETGALHIANTCPSKDPVELSMTFPPPINSDRDVKLPSRRDPVPNASFSRHRNDIKLGSRDDDENFSRFNKLSNRFKASRPPTRIGDRRIRKLLTSKYWKVAPKLNDFENSRAGIKPLYRKRKTCYNYDRCQYDTLYKRRKFSDRSSIVTSDGGNSSESVSNSPGKVMNGDKSSSAALSHGGCGVSSFLTGHQASHPPKDSHVKFSIKSFRIPELYVEVPETATVGSLKRTVMEAVTALLGGGIRVGVLLQGKKVRDDSRTLSQTGISCEDNLDAIGFTLEPGPAKAPPLVCSEEPPLLLSCEAAPQNLISSPATPAVDTGILDASPDPPSLTNSANHVDSNNEPVSSQTDMLTDQSLPQSRALVPVPAMNVEALAVVPVNQKSRKSELAHRRTRRPFSVSEVEALVQAVEELGTGRWRDVKLRAFENAEHRTYVDLKDKWKTLVHTAKISPQQRRGEPVPQELLDRVLAAHAYWSQHQAKQQGKHHAGTLRLTDAQADRNGVAAAIPTVMM
ncbi:PREDICTED: telomere repeat-binding protein 3 [Theobroma cacao]|uniref:Telomere repeat-binding protein 3 n=1 Tax=Theobroma cacao TaxID=3641 RepID=A0AB32X3B6_THECC|nr:PREDICTED: telomere repeat-binding protein 3 [Theobroma cacao]